MTVTEQLTLQDKEFQAFVYSDQSRSRSFSSYIAASASIRTLMNEKEELNLALVFPNSQNLINEFLVYEILHAIQSGEIKANYNLDNFSIGEKVNVGKASLIFKGKDSKYIYLQCSDLDKVSIPINLAPILQKSNSKQLSRFNLFDEERKKMGSSFNLLSAIAANKTHMDKTIVYINLDSSMADIIDDLSKTDLNRQSLKDLLYITKLVNGKPENVFSTRESGISPLLCASDFVDLVNSDVHNHIHSIIIKHSHRIENNIPFLQSLFTLNVPITLLMDSKDYIQSSIMSSFKAWIWDKDSIKDFYSLGEIYDYTYINNCANQEIQYEILEDKVINNCFISITNAFGMIKKNNNSFDGYMFVISLYQMVLDLVRSPYSCIESEIFASEMNNKLTEISDELEDKRNFLDPACYDDLRSVILNLSNVYSSQTYSLAKGVKLKELLTNISSSQKTVYLIIPDNTNRHDCFQYFEKINTNLIILHTNEFLDIDASDSICIVIGWLPRKQMLQLLYSYNSQQIIVLLYSAENYRWKEHTKKMWENKLSDSNRLLLSINNNKVDLSFGKKQQIYDDYDEEESFRQTILLSRHKKYREQDNNTERALTVEASSIELSDSQFMFITDKHKMLIVDSSLSKVHSYQINDVKEGDYLVIRKSSKDIIREEADRILQSNGFINAREIASEWKPLLADLFWEYNRKYTLLYDALKAKGCSVMIQTFRMWINEPDMIMMDSITDLESIIKLSYKKPVHSTDEIYDCGMLVREAHKEAGKTISEKLRLYLMRNKSRDIFDTTIDMDIPDVGAISLMKISSVSHEKETVEAKYVHRLLS